MSNADLIDWGEESAPASVPTNLPLVTYHGSAGQISGDAQVVAGIHRSDRLFALYETMVLAGLASVSMTIAALLIMYAPAGREFIVTCVASTGWVLALGLGGFTAFRLRMSATGVSMSGNHHD